MAPPGITLDQAQVVIDGRIITFPGGVPLTADDVIVGAAGVSGGIVDQDQAVVEAAAGGFHG